MLSSFLLLSSLAAFATSSNYDPFEALTSLGQPPAMTYGVREGLPQATIHCLARDRDGYLWVGTDAGVGRFDGARWTAFRMPGGARSSVVSTITTSSDGAIWFGLASGGLARLSKGALSLIADTPGRVKGLVAFRDDPNDIWVATLHGLRHFVHGKWGPVPPELASERLFGVTTVRDAAGEEELWIATSNGLAQVSGSTLVRRVSLSPGLLHNRVYSLAADARREGLWAVTGHAAYYVKSGKIMQTVPSPSGQIRQVVETIAPDGTRCLWATTDKGLARYRAGTWAFMREPGPSGTLQHMLAVPGEDGTAMLWVGSNSAGLTRLRLGRWLQFEERQAVYRVFAQRQPPPTLWYATFSRISHVSWKGRQELQLPVDENFLKSITEGTDGSTPSPALWLGTLNRGLFRFDGRRSSPVSMPALERSIQALASGRGPDGRPCIWVGTSRGVGRIQDGRWVALQGLPQNATPVEALAFDETSDSLWIGTSAGLFRVARDDVRHIPVPDPVGPQAAIRCLRIHRPPDGPPELWIGTVAHGAVVLDLDPARFRLQFSTQTSTKLADDQVYAVVVDQTGRVYLSGRGVVRLTPLNKARTSFSAELFTGEDGLGVGDMSPGAHVDHRGRVWVGSVSGLAMLDPGTEVREARDKSLVVEGLTIEGRQTAPESVPVLRYDQNDVEFEYALPSVFRGGETEYLTQLIGYDGVAQGWRTNTKRTYTNLPPGHYSFTIQARDSAGQVYGPREVTFRIRPAPWRTWWAYLLYAGVLISLGVAGQRLRMRRQLAVERLRTRIALDLHDDLGARLTLIQMQAHNLGSRMLQDDGAAQALSTISVAAGEAVAGMREVLWSIDPAHDHLSDVLARMRRVGLDACEAAGVVFSLEASVGVDLPLQPDQRRDLLRLMKECLNNAIRHGKPRSIRAAIRRRGADLHFVFEDDGAGFDAVAVEPGYGLRSIVDRAERLGGLAKVRSAPGQGTQIVVTFPVRRGRRVHTQPAGTALD